MLSRQRQLPALPVLPVLLVPLVLFVCVFIFEFYHIDVRVVKVNHLGHGEDASIGMQLGRRNALAATECG